MDSTDQVLEVSDASPELINLNDPSLEQATDNRGDTQKQSEDQSADQSADLSADLSADQQASLDELPEVPTDKPGEGEMGEKKSQNFVVDTKTADSQLKEKSANQNTFLPREKISVKYHFRDINKTMFEAFHEFLHEFEDIEVSMGDIFRGAPAVDAIVSPANSFGFMDGGIDMAYSRHFGWQLSRRLQHVIRTEYDGELLVGQAIILPTFENEVPENKDWSKYNEGQPIHYLISAPTMRVPLDVSETVNAYLAFRAVVLAVNRHNSAGLLPPIRSVLCPGLGTAVGRMPKRRCAQQVRRAYECFVLGLHPTDIEPRRLDQPYMLHEELIIDVKDEAVRPPPTVQEISRKK